MIAQMRFRTPPQIAWLGRYRILRPRISRCVRHRMKIFSSCLSTVPSIFYRSSISSTRVFEHAYEGRHCRLLSGVGLSLPTISADVLRRSMLPCHDVTRFSLGISCKGSHSNSVNSFLTSPLLCGFRVVGMILWSCSEDAGGTWFLYCRRYLPGQGLGIQCSVKGLLSIWAKCRQA